MRSSRSSGARRVDLCLFRVGRDRKSLNAFRLCNLLSQRGHEISLTAVGRGHEHAWFPLAVKPRYVVPADGARRWIYFGGAGRAPFDLSLHRSLDALAAALPFSEVQLCLDLLSLQAAAESGRGQAWLWRHEGISGGISGRPSPGTALYPRHIAARELLVSPVLADRVELETPQRVEVLRPGIDLEVFRPLRDGGLAARGDRRRKKGMTVVFLGDEGDWGGLDVLEEAAEEVRRAVPACDFVMCGASRPGRQAAASLRFRLMASPHDLSDLYRSAAVVAGCYPRGVYPLAPLEAMACGAPTVISSDPPVDYADDGVDALLAKPEDAASLAEKVSALLEDRHRAEALGEKAARSATKFSWQDAADELERLLESPL